MSLDITQNLLHLLCIVPLSQTRDTLHLAGHTYRFCIETPDALDFTLRGVGGDGATRVTKGRDGVTSL